MILLAAVATPVTQEPKEKDKKADSFKLTKQEQEILDLTNKERTKAGLKPLKANEKLTKAAREHSKNMARQEKMDHELDGKTPAARVRKAGYKFNAMAENIAYGQRTVEEVLESWMTSEGHRANILNPKYREIGIGVAPGSKGVLYFTQVFGRARTNTMQ
jgi:uncharacterized protein YkwD